MQSLKAITVSLSVLALAGGFAGCSKNQPQAFKTSLLRTVPPTPSAVEEAPPPLEAASIDLQSPPSQAVRRALNLRGPNAADVVVRDADWRFQAGRKCYLQGDEECARREFDRAIEILLSLPAGAVSRSEVERKLEQLVDAIHRYDLTGLGSGDLLSEPGFEKPPIEELTELTFPVDPKLKNKVVEEIRATVSQLPLEATDPVLSYVNYFSSERGRKVIIAGMRRAGRYRSMIQRILDEEGVPQELIFLAQAESGFMPRAVSRKAATGMWQFMQSRGREYGLMQSAWHDDRLDPERATRAAARHLRDLFHRYGDWYLAMAAYNCGPGNVDKAVERTGYADFWELWRRNVLPRETRNYVPAILAMTIVAKNSREYGIDSDDIDPDPPLQYDVMEITSPTNLVLIADLAESPVSQIRDLNPALLKNIALANTLLRVPKGASGQIAAALAAIPVERRDQWRAHRVTDGEDLASVARLYRTSADELLAANKAIEGDVVAGDLLIIPQQPPKPVVKKATKSAVRRKAARRPATKAAAKKASAKGGTVSAKSRSTKSRAVHTAARAAKRRAVNR